MSAFEEAQLYAWTYLRTEFSEQYDARMREYLQERDYTWDLASLLRPEQIVEAVARAAGVEVEELYRPFQVVAPRSVAMLLIRERVPGMSFPRIAQLFRAHHATVIKACQRAQKALKDPDSPISRLWRQVEIELASEPVLAA